MILLTNRAEIERPIDEVFERLTDLSSYATWLSTSAVFRECSVARNGSVGARSGSGRMRQCKL